MKEVFGLAPEIPPEETVRSAEGWLEPDGRIRDILPEETRLLDMGEHRLKNLLRPEHIFQVDRTDLPSDFPALLTLDHRPNNLPAQMTPLIDREREIEAIRQRLLHEGCLRTLRDILRPRRTDSKNFSL